MNTLTAILAVESVIPFVFITLFLIAVVVKGEKKYKHSRSETAFYTVPTLLFVTLQLCAVCDIAASTIFIHDIYGYDIQGVEVLQTERESEGFTGELTGNLVEGQQVKGSNGQVYQIHLIKGDSTPELQEGFYKEITTNQTITLISPIGKLLAGNKRLNKIVEETNIYIYRVQTKVLTQPEVGT